MVKVKNFFKKAGLWFKNHAPTKRRLIQIYAALLFNCNFKGYTQGTIYQGNTKKLCVPGLNCYSCPGAIGACPLGSLQDSLAQSGRTAPFYILGILALFGLVLARTICGFLCPVGLGQELLYKIKTPKLKKSRYTRILSYFKYVLLVLLVIAIPLIYNGIPAFCKYVCPAGTFGGAIGLLANGNNADYFAMLGYLFSWKFILLIVFIVASIFVFRFFCRFICPLGAILGFFNKVSLLGVKLEKNKCIDCGACLNKCKMDIRRVGDHECINCGECIPVCPTKAISWKGSKLILEPTSLFKAKSVAEAAGEAPKLSAVLAEGTTVQSEANSVAETVTEEVNAANTEVEKTTETAAQTVENRLKKRCFWMQFSAWALAIAVLITMVVYYNFLAPAKTATVYAVGDRCPDFTLETIYDTAGAYDKDGNKLDKFSTLENHGTVMVINFWYTECDPCKEELPFFSEVKKEYGDKIVMAVVHANDGTSATEVQRCIDSYQGEFGKYESYRDYGMIFTHDTDEVDSYTMLGGKASYPVTVIINTDYKISFVMQGKIGKDVLKNEINKALGE